MKKAIETIASATMDALLTHLFEPDSDSISVHRFQGKGF
jgi:hypothetical protein